jgi:uncharacterized protein
MKYLIVVLVVVIVLSLLLGKRRGRRSEPRPPSGPEGMVRCVQCGIHLPRSEALLKEGRTYCSNAHLEQDRRNPPP